MKNGVANRLQGLDDYRKTFLRHEPQLRGPLPLINVNRQEPTSNPKEKGLCPPITPSEASSVKAGTTEQTGLPEHLMQLSGGVWKLWRWVGLRGTGFPAAQVLKLSAPDCAIGADQLIDAEQESQRNQEQALTLVRELLNALRRNNQWGNIAKRKPLVSVMRALKKNELPAPAHITDEIKQVVATFEAASVSRDIARSDFRLLFEKASVKLSRAVREVASSKRFQEAVLWQNRHAFHSAIIPLLRPASDFDSEGSKQRQHKELIASYLQRYCVKNDTIGFFGPVGWARLVSQETALSARPGPNLLASRTVYFEAWCIDALAEMFNKNPAIRPWIAPRPVPYFYLEGTILHLPLARPIVLSASQAMALRLCNGVLLAKEIVASLMQLFPGEVKDEAEGYDLLEHLSARGLILWKLIVPPELFPERTLRSLLERIEDESLRKPALDVMDELEKERHAIAQTAGNPEALDRALANLDGSFTRLSGVASTRSAGKMYAARTPIYEDCRRDVELEVGLTLVEQLGPALSLVLTTARWFTFQVAESYRKLFRKVFLELVRSSKSTIVDCPTFWYRVQPLVFDGTHRVANAIVPDFQRRWAEVLSIPDGKRRITYREQKLRPLVESTFAAPRPGWSFARYHSPDVMIAADGVEAIRSGDYQLVLGELHLATNTLRGSLFVAQHPYPQEIFRAVELDLPQVALRIAPPKSWPGLTARTNPTLLPAENFRLLVTHDSFCGPEAQALPIGSLVIEEFENELSVRTRDGRLRFDIIEAFADILSSQVVNKFKILPATGHTPRISLDRLVISRESWNFSPSEMLFAYEKSNEERFLAARRWAQSQDIPRFVFVKSRVEVKPMYVDFDSPIYVDIFAKIVRRTKESEYSESLISVAEMLPNHDQNWLEDIEGQRYTSELRIVAVDSTM